MRIYLTVIALLIFATGIFLSNRNFLDKRSNLSPQNQEVLSETSQPQENIEGNEVSIENEVVNLMKTPKPSPTSEPSSTNVPISSGLSDYRYPGAEVVASSENSLTLRSNDEPKTITNWYQAKIESEKMNVESFVETSANDQVLNTLVAADGEREIKVEIKKESTASPVEIFVTLKI